jgi:hypothetical protein
MRYALLIYDAETANPSADPPPPEVMQQVMDAYNAFTRECREAGVYVGGEALQPVTTATTVTVADGNPFITDGPFMETKEALGGFYLLDCKDLDEALSYAAKCPGARFGKIEVRPIWEVR